MENLEKLLENYNAGHDAPDSRDYTIDEVLEGWGASGDYSLNEFPDEVHNNITPPLNQGSVGACTLFGSAGAYFETYAQAIKPQAYMQPFTLWDIWNIAKSKGASDTQGWWLQSILQLLVDLKKTGNYVLLGSNNIDDKAIYNMCKAIAEGRNFVTGFYYVDWSEVVKTWKYVKSSRTSGHIVYFNRFKKWNYPDGSRVAFWSPNNWNGRGSFWITEKELKNSYIFKQYTWLLSDEHQKFADAKKKRKNAYLQKAYEKKIWNEERPADAATAFEIRVMLNRALGLPDNYQFFRKHFALMCEDRILRGKMKLWNEERPYELASDEEVAIMFTRAVTRNSELNVLVLTREQVAEVGGRDFM